MWQAYQVCGGDEMTGKCTWHFDYFEGGIMARTYILHADCLNVTIDYIGLPVYELCPYCGKTIKYEFPDDENEVTK